MAKFSMPFNLQQWIDEHRDQLKPPVCNKQIFEQDDYIVMVVGGPNNRSDFHYNETPELFYQLEGEMVLRVVNDDTENDNTDNDNNQKCYTQLSEEIAKSPNKAFEVTNIAIKAGEIFLLPPKVLHSPQRFENSVGLVVEQKRAQGQQDALFWFCEKCSTTLYSEQFSLDNIEKDLPLVFSHFYEQSENCQCKNCGHIAKRA